MARATRKDVATLANVSVSTVSHIMNNRGEELGFSADTEERVRKAAQKLGYIPRASARNFRYQDSRVIAFFTTEAPSSLRLPVFNELITSAIETAREANYFILPIPVNDDPLGTVAGTIRDIELAGAVVRDDVRLRDAIPLLLKNDVPSVWVNTGLLDAPDPQTTSIVVEEEPGVLEMLSSFNVSTVVKPVLISGPGKDSGRIETFLQYFPNAVRVNAGGWSFHDGYEVGAEVAGSEPDLIFAANDYLAYGFMSYAADNNLFSNDFPRIFGFGDVGALPTSPNRLSSIEWPLAEASRLAVDVLIHHLRDTEPLSKGVIRVLKTSAHPRESTR
ncbi:LacI family DNA-binding transcriptional regulator [Gleimia coleocanis]|nr:LacI family DNA-binding transcriptional regulator [Gleimia coleocanis]